MVGTSPVQVSGLMRQLSRAPSVVYLAEETADMKVVHTDWKKDMKDRAVLTVDVVKDCADQIDEGCPLWQVTEVLDTEESREQGRNEVLVTRMEVLLADPLASPSSLGPAPV